MVKYKVLKTFRDKDTQKIFEVGSEIEIPVKRANEIEKSLGGSALSRLDDEEKKVIE